MHGGCSIEPVRPVWSGGAWYFSDARRQCACGQINHPSDHFDQVAALVKTKFPQITLWAIFDSDSAALKNELTRMGFEKIISYRDHLSELITAHELGT